MLGLIFLWETSAQRTGAGTKVISVVGDGHRGTTEFVQERALKTRDNSHEPPKLWASAAVPSGLQEFAVRSCSPAIHNLGSPSD